MAILSSGGVCFFEDVGDVSSECFEGLLCTPLFPLCWVNFLEEDDCP